jgi:hypothetical protein
MVLALLSHGRGEVLVDLLVMAPMQWLKYGTFEVQMAEGPEGAIGKAIVKPPGLWLA